MAWQPLSSPCSALSEDGNVRQSEVTVSHCYWDSSAQPGHRRRNAQGPVPVCPPDLRDSETTSPSQ